MKHSGRVLVLTAAAILAAWVLPVSNVHAVLLTSPVVAESGEAVANTSIQIFQDGNKIGEEKTDDRGMLGFVFPGRGEYTLKYQSGGRMVEKRMKLGLWNTTTTTQKAVAGGGAAAVLVGGGILIASGGDGDGNGNGGSGLSASDIAGTYALGGSRTAGACHGFGAAIANPGVRVSASGSSVTFHSSADISGTVGSDNTFRGGGTYVSSSGCTIRETLEGTFSRDAAGNVVFTGTLTFEDLTCGCSVVYRVTYTKVS